MWGRPGAGAPNSNKDPNFKKPKFMNVLHHPENRNGLVSICIFSLLFLCYNYRSFYILSPTYISHTDTKRICIALGTHTSNKD